MSRLRRAARPVAALSLVLVLAACGSSDGSGAGTHQGDSSSSSSSVSAARSGDIMFAQMMIPHHEQAVEMAEVALAKDGVSEQVKALATNIKGAQGPEIQTMTAWLKQWNASPLASGNTDHGGGHGTGMMSEQDMGSLSAAEGAEFDRQWLTMMIEHHEGAIEMADNVLATTSDAQVKALAEAIISGQEAEITTMKGLLS